MKEETQKKNREKSRSRSQQPKSRSRREKTAAEVPKSLVSSSRRPEVPKSRASSSSFGAPESQPRKKTKLALKPAVGGRHSDEAESHDTYSCSYSYSYSDDNVASCSVSRDRAVGKVEAGVDSPRKETYGATPQRDEVQDGVGYHIPVSLSSSRSATASPVGRQVPVSPSRSAAASPSPPRRQGKIPAVGGFGFGWAWADRQEESLMGGRWHASVLE